MLPPLPRCSRWAYSSLKITHPCQPSPVPRPGRPAHRPFRGLLSVHSRCGLHTRTVTVCRDRYPKASDTSSPPCLLRSLPAGAIAGWGLHPLEKRRLVTAHVETGHCVSCGRRPYLRSHWHHRLARTTGDPETAIRWVYSFFRLNFIPVVKLVQIPDFMH